MNSEQVNGNQGLFMGTVLEVFWAILIVGVPIALFTLAMVWWALGRGDLKESTDTKALQRELNSLSKKNKNKKESKTGKTQHPLQKKWMKFGGGFYGIVAFFTYIVVEVIEISDMIMNVGGLIDFLKQLDFDVIISMVVNAFMNFATAMMWPAYWMNRIDTNQTWVWFVIAYGGYWLGLKLAQVLIQRRLDAET